MSRILLVQPHLHHPGGGSAVGAWMIEALRHAHDVTVLGTDPVDVAALNHLYGTSLRASDFTLRRPPLAMHIASRLEPHPFGAQRTAWVIRAAKRIQKSYDIVMTAQNELDLGRRAIQYVHHPIFDAAYERRQLMRRPPWGRALWTRLKYRYRPWWLISGFSFTRMRTNLTLVNSEWTGERVRRLYDIPTRTLYPPTAGPVPDQPWSERTCGFICAGRLVEEKRVLEIIDIISAVRSHAPDVTLSIVGVRGSRPGDERYYDEVRRAVDAHPAWISLHENLPRDTMLRLMARHRFGIHGMTAEHYGMAVAEMVSAGCVVFVPNDGGQVEIVGRDTRLCYDSTAEAVHKIVAVLTDEAAQADLRRRLRSSDGILSADRFAVQLLEIVEHFTAT